MMTDYDRTELPTAYDQGRDHGPEMIALWMDAIASRLQYTPRVIVDLGCGTGRFSDALATHFEAAVIGIDPSFRMIERALRKPAIGRVYYQLGRAEARPVASASADLSYMSMSLHHFTDPQLAAFECRRALRVGGSIVVRTGTRERI
jgi:ubiquinone/menaquinone biosynthesis C-methylase UbiE